MQENCFTVVSTAFRTYGSRLQQQVCLIYTSSTDNDALDNAYLLIKNILADCYETISSLFSCSVCNIIFCLFTRTVGTKWEDSRCHEWRDSFTPSPEPYAYMYTSEYLYKCMFPTKVYFIIKSSTKCRRS